MSAVTQAPVGGQATAAKDATRPGRPLAGSLESRTLSDGRTAWTGRFMAYGRLRKVTIGHYPPMSEDQARRELDFVVEQVRHGFWSPAARPAPPAQALAIDAAASEPTIREVATEWLAHLQAKGTGEHQLVDMGRLISVHIVGFFGEHTPRQVTIGEVERFIASKQKERNRLDELRAAGQTHMMDRRRGRQVPLPKGLGARRLNRTVRTLYRILDYAKPRYGTPSAAELREIDLLVKVPEPDTVALSAPELALLLEAGAILDAQADGRNRHVGHQAFLGCLGLAGLRLSEGCEMAMLGYVPELERLRVKDSKTSAGRCSIPITPFLQPILAEHVHKRRAGAEPGAPLFATRSGTFPDGNNMRPQVFEKALAIAQELAKKRKLAPLPCDATPHSLRLSYVTHQLERGLSTARVMKLAGHRSAKLTLEVYDRLQDAAEPVHPMVYELYGPPVQGGERAVDQGTV